VEKGNERTKMITIQKVRVADCDRSTDDKGRYTSPAWQWVVCDNNDIEASHGCYDSESEAEMAAAEWAAAAEEVWE